jgi:putative transposase
MSRKRYTPEQIIGKLREEEVALAQGQKVAQVCRILGIAEQTFYRLRREYGGLKIEQAKRLKALEKENTRLRRADLGLMYFAAIDPATGRLAVLNLTPTKIRNFRVNRASQAEAQWPGYVESGRHEIWNNRGVKPR